MRNFVLLAFAITASLNICAINSQRQWRLMGSVGAGYNEACSELDNSEEEVLNCDSTKNLTCSAAKICECKKDENSGIVFTFNAETGSCSPPIVEPLQAQQVGLDGSLKCLTSSQCRESILGSLSRCNENSRCECYDTITEGQKLVVKVGKVCQYHMSYGDSCSTDRECNGTIIGEAICNNTNPASNQKTCQCHFDYIWDNKIQECLKISDTGLDFICRSDLQCSHTSALGRLSRCSEETRTCECFDVESNGRVQTAYHQVYRRCHYKRGINESCTDTEECRLGSSLLAVCTEIDKLYNPNKWCQCKEGYVWGGTHEENRDDCLPLGKYHQSCTDDRQCYHANALGELSTCAKIEGSWNPRLGHCECMDTRNGGALETGFHSGKCYFKRRANETCELTEECIVGYHKNAICSEHPSYFSLNVCVCPDGQKCNAAVGSYASFSFTLIALVFHFYF